MSNEMLAGHEKKIEFSTHFDRECFKQTFQYNKILSTVTVKETPPVTQEKLIEKYENLRNFHIFIQKGDYEKYQS